MSPSFSGGVNLGTTTSTIGTKNVIESEPFSKERVEKYKHYAYNIHMKDVNWNKRYQDEILR